MMSNSLNRFFVVSAFSFLLLLLVNSGEVFSEETEVAKNGTTTSAENSNSTSAAGKDSPALISLHPPHSPLLRESQLSSLSSSPPPLPPPRYNRRPPPQPRQPSYYSHPHNPHQYHHHHPHDHSHDHHHHHPYPNPHHYDDPYHHHYHHPHHLHSSPSPSFYPRSPPPTPSLLPALDPAQLGDLVSGFGQAFSNFLSQRVRAAPADRQARLLNGEHNILATASQLLPAAANRLLGGLQQLQQQPGFGIQSRSTLSPLRGLAQSPKSSSGNETTSSSSSSSPEDGQPSAAASSDHQTMVSSSEPLSPPPSPSPSSSPPGAPPINYDEEGRRLREDIIARVGHLQNVLTTAMEVSKERRDILTRRLLEQTNLRLEQAKARMDRILSEPQNAQMVLRALQTVNQGVSGITAFLQGLLQRINVSVNVKMNEPPPPSNFSTELPPDSSNGTITAAASKPE